MVGRTKFYIKLRKRIRGPIFFIILFNFFISIRWHHNIHELIEVELNLRSHSALKQLINDV